MSQIKFTELHPNLLMRGHTKSCNTEAMLHALEDRGVRMVVNVAIIKDEILEAGCRTVGITYLHVPLSDSKTNRDMDAVIDLIRKVAAAIENYPVMVHCDSGRNRSALVAIPALASLTGRSTKELLEEARRARPIARGLLANKLFEEFVLGWPMNVVAGEVAAGRANLR